MRRHLTIEQIRALRLRAQGFAQESLQPFSSAVPVVKRIVGAQAQEHHAGLLSIRARSTGLTAEQIERERNGALLAWTWAMRGTLHLVDSADAAWLVPLLGPGLAAGGMRRMAQLGWNDENVPVGLRVLDEELTQTGGLIREEITRLLAENGLPHEGQATFHLIFRAALEGRVVRGPFREREPVYVPFSDWLGPPQPFERNTGLGTLAKRYLQGFAPAGVKDLAAWAGIKAREANAAWKEISAELVSFEGPAGEVCLLKSQLAWLEEPMQNEPVVRLLPRFDTYLLGYSIRDLDASPENMRKINRGGGMIHQVLMVDGRALGVWRTRPGTALGIEIELFEPLPDELRPLLEKEAADVGRFLGVEAELSILP